MRQNAKNIVFFLLLAGGMTALWWYADRHWLPKPQPPQAEEVANGDDDKAKPPETKPDPKTLAAVVGTPLAEPLPPVPQNVEPPPPPPPPTPPPLTPREPATLIALGDAEHYYTRFLLNTQGGGVQQAVLNGFNQGTRLGKAADGLPPLYLIPGIDRSVPAGTPLVIEPPLPDLQPGIAPDPENPNTPPSKQLIDSSYTIFHYSTPDAKYPDPLLGEKNWKLVEDTGPGGDTHRVVFETELPDPYFLKFRKIYTLGRKDYHINLRLEIEKTGGAKGQGKTRLQISGPRQLPIEGEWYTYTTRVALFGWTTPKEVFRRHYEDAATVTNLRGGEAVVRADNTFKYAAITTPYFSSGLAIVRKEGVESHPWSYIRATSELGFIPPPDEFVKLEEALRADPKNTVLAERLAAARRLRDRKQPELDDITFRAVTDELDLAPGQKIVHEYAIYNGPTKVRQLKLLTGEQAVDSELVDRYHDEFGLRTLTDYQSPNALGRFANAIYWTDLVIVFTNLMHWLLWVIHQGISWAPASWGLSIILLTVFVRLLLFFPSRKQTQMNLKMMEVQKRLKPELDKLHEKYKDDFQTYNREKTKLMMQHGLNPFAAMGGCLLLLAQMPIFMGLYFCLQESIFFRLEPFGWISNLAAPDMSIWWSEKIPLISDPENRHGMWSILYLGPYLNILPLVSVGLMLYMQQKMMPPPTDEQMAAQQRMMKFMMIIIAVMFFKVAAGLALYFTISTLWGIIERQVIPKPEIKPDEGGTGTGAERSPRGGSPNGTPDKPKGFLGRFRDRLKERLEELQKQAEEQSSRQVKNPNRQEPIRNPDRPPPDRPDRKKKRRR